MGEWLEWFFKLRELGTTCRREVIGGFTTFATMSYIIAVNPAMLGAAGIPPGPSMVAPVVRIEFADFTESVPALTVIALMSFTYNIAIGITAGFLLYPAFKFAAGRYREVRPGLWALGALSALFFIFYPYR